MLGAGFPLLAFGSAADAFSAFGADLVPLLGAILGQKAANP